MIGQLDRAPPGPALRAASAITALLDQQPCSRWLSVREFPSGPGILADAESLPADLLEGVDEILLLIHGFNVTVASAVRAYHGFGENFGSTARELLAGIFWPGDTIPFRGDGTAEPSLVSTFLSALDYADQIDAAKVSARRISKAIVAELDRREDVAEETGSKRPPLRLFIAAHSLGCRVTLELLDDLRNRSKREIVIPAVALMAAAVPMYHVEQDGDLEDALLKADNVLIYTSWRDAALLGFRIGQLGESFYPRSGTFRAGAALGRSGLELEGKVHRRTRQYGHSRYWSDKSIAREVAELVVTGRLPG